MPKQSLNLRKTPKLDVVDGFFFYSLYKNGNNHDKNQAKKLIKIYYNYPQNRSKVIKEIIDMGQLISDQIINIYDFLSKNPVNPNYAAIFENFVRRYSAYEQQADKKLFSNLNDLINYRAYLINATEPKVKSIETIARFIYKDFNNK